MLGLGASPSSLRSSDDPGDELASGGVGVIRCVRCTELLLLRDGSSAVSSYRFLEKKVLRDAVIGVVGVFGNCRERGGLMLRSAGTCSLDALLLKFGILRGPRLMGGRLKGCKFFLLEGVPGFSVSWFAVFINELCRALDLRWVFVGSGCTGIEMLPVELL